MYLKDYPVDIPFETKKVVVRKEKRVTLETERTYNRERQDTRVKRVTIGQVVPLFPGKMYPNENYFTYVVSNSVPEEIRDAFLRRCARKRELEELKKDPERMMRQVEEGLRFLKEEGRKIRMKAAAGRETGTGEELTRAADGETGVDGEPNEDETFWFITNAHDLEYVMKVFGELYSLMEIYASRNPMETLDAYKVKMFNRILDELKLTMPEHRILQGLELIKEPGDGEPEMTYSDVLMLLTWYKNCLRD